MSNINSYKDLLVWQKSMVLVQDVYELTSSLPKSEDYGLTSQIKRSAISIPSNIAEGWGRSSNKSYCQFLRIAKGSLFELETQLIIAEKLNYLENINSISGLIIEIGKMLSGLIRSIDEKEKISLN